MRIVDQLDLCKEYKSVIENPSEITDSPIAWFQQSGMTISGGELQLWESSVGDCWLVPSSTTEVAEGIINGHHAVAFAGGEDLVFTDSGNSPTPVPLQFSSGFTIFLVISATSPQTGLAFLGSADAETRFKFSNDTTLQVTDSADTASFIYAPGFNSVRIITIYWDGVQDDPYGARVNGTTISESATGFDAPWFFADMGAYGAGNFSGFIAEVLMYSGQMAPRNRSLIEHYLRARFGLSTW